MAEERDALARSGYMTKEEICARLREKGLRMTAQRRIIIDIVTEEDYSCCKEVYLLAHKRDESIGIATVYRMINVLEELGALSRGSLSKLPCNGRCCDMKAGCTVLTDKSRQIILSEEDMQEALAYIMKKKGYDSADQIRAVLVDEA